MPLLFSYGTLQQQNVQLSTFGRLLRGEPDQLVGFEQSQIVIDDPQVVATSGKSRHTIVKFNGRDDSRVSGTVFEITDAELASADRYEVAAVQADCGDVGIWKARLGVRGCARVLTICERSPSASPGCLSPPIIVSAVHTTRNQAELYSVPARHAGRRERRIRKQR